VASIIMASSDNAHQVAGIDHFARLLPLKALDSQFGKLDHLVAALDYLVLNPGIADVVNMSLANYSPFPTLDGFETGDVSAWDASSP
jgi:subtilisin family serine protease